MSDDYDDRIAEGARNKELMDLRRRVKQLETALSKLDRMTPTGRTYELGLGGFTICRECARRTSGDCGAH